MQKLCKNCGEAVEQSGNRERLFCDDACRKAYKRKTQSGQMSELKADKSKADTPKTQSGQTLCKGCQKSVGKLCEICHECIAKGMTRKSLNLPEVKREYFTDKLPSKMNWQRKGWTKAEALERAIHSIASIGCDCIVGDKIYESKRVMKVADKFV